MRQATLTLIKFVQDLKNKEFFYLVNVNKLSAIQEFLGQQINFSSTEEQNFSCEREFKSNFLLINDAQ